MFVCNLVNTTYTNFVSEINTDIKSYQEMLENGTANSTIMYVSQKATFDANSMEKDDMSTI